MENRSQSVVLIAAVCVAIGSEPMPLHAMTLGAVGVEVSEDFDSMETADSTAAIPGGFRVGAGASPTYVGGLSETTQYTGTVLPNIISSMASGGTYNFGNGNRNSSTERALGFVNSGAFSSPRSIMVEIVNNTGSELAQLDVAWDYEKYRSGTRQYDWTFFVSTDGNGWAANTIGDQINTVDADIATVYHPPESAAKSLSITGLSIANGASYFLRWNLTGVGGSTNAQARAIDNFRVTGVAAVPPDTTPPTVASIVRQSPGSSPTNADDVTWRVSFDEAINAGTVAPDDFTLTPTAGVLGGAAISGVGIVSATTFDVTASTGTGNKTLRLDVLPAATIADAAGNDYAATFNSGQTYQIDRTEPTSSASTPASQVGGAITVTSTPNGTGSALASATLYAREASGTWASVGSIAGGTAIYTPPASGLYYFQTVATDTAGNSEPIPSGTMGTGDDSTVYNSNANAALALDVPAGALRYFPMTSTAGVTIDFSAATPSTLVTVSRATGDLAPGTLAAAKLIDESISIAGTFSGTANIVWTFDVAATSPLDAVFRDNAGTVTEFAPIGLVGSTITINGVLGFSTWYAGDATADVPVSSIGDWMLMY